METKNPSSANLLKVLAIRPFLFLWLAQVVSQIAFNMLILVLGLFIYQKTRSNTAVSLLYLTVGLPGALFGVFSGVYIDRIDKRSILIVSTLIRVFFIFLIFITKSNLILIYILTSLVSLASQFFVPAEAALIPRFVPTKLLLSANSLFTLTFYSAIIGGFVAGGPLVESLGADSVFIILGLLFGCAFWLVTFIPKEESRSSLPRIKLTTTSIWNDVTSGFDYIKYKPLLYQSILLLTVSQAVIAIFASLGPGFADRVLSIKITQASLLILGPAALGMIIGALYLGSFGTPFRKRSLINIGIFLSGATLLLVAILVRTRRYLQFTSVFEHIFLVSHSKSILPISMICFFVLGFANSLIDVSCNTILQEKTTDAFRGRVYGFLSSLISGVAIIPVIISGVIADLFGIGKIIFILGLILIGFGLYTSNQLAHFRRRF